MIETFAKHKITASLIVGASILVAIVSGTTASSLSGSQFSAGRIIDDGLFYNGETMTAAQIQSFLNSKVPTCDTNGTQPYAGTTRAEYGTAKGYPPPYTCLKSFKQNTPYRAGESGLCSAITAKTGRTAAQIIDDVARACHISQKVIIVMLQKEQGLVTDDWPWSIQYRGAMGYGCPDDADCSAEYYGFFNQVYNAARQFQRYKADPSNWNHVPRMTNKVLYQANAPSCGYKNVFIENYATAGLYNYTPYTPNKAALDNLYGTGDSCSAYGNRNFWRYYNDWFGSTTIAYQALDSPRDLQTRADVYKKDIQSGASVDSILSKGTKLRFETKAYINGKWYLRTKYDTDNRLDKGLLLSDLEEITLTYTPLSREFVMQLTSDSYAKNIHTGQNTGGLIRKGTVMRFTSETSNNGKQYWRTTKQTSDNVNIGFEHLLLTDAPIHFVPLDDPRVMETSAVSYAKDIRTESNVGTSIPKGTRYFIERKVNYGGVWYVQNEQQANEGLNQGFPLSSLATIPRPAYTPLDHPRTMQLINNSSKQLLLLDRKEDTVFSKNTRLRFTTKVLLNGIWYLRTESDSVNMRDKAFASSDVADIPIEYVPLDKPREITINNDTRKFDIRTGAQIDNVLRDGTRLYFDTKSYHDGRWYLRTKYDTQHGLNKGVFINYLSL